MRGETLSPENISMRIYPKYPGRWSVVSSLSEDEDVACLVRAYLDNPDSSRDLVDEDVCGECHGEQAHYEKPGTHTRTFYTLDTRRIPVLYGERIESNAMVLRREHPKMSLSDSRTRLPSSLDHCKNHFYCKIFQMHTVGTRLTRTQSIPLCKQMILWSLDKKITHCSDLCRWVRISEWSVRFHRNENDRKMKHRYENKSPGVRLINSSLVRSKDF